MHSWHLVAALAIAAAGANGAQAAPILLFEQDFESPTGILVGGACCTDLSQQPVNTLFGTAFQQLFTVETLAIDGPAGLYSDPAGIGGNYTLSLLSIVENDKVSLNFNTAGLTFLNMGWTISPIAADQPAGLPFTDTFGISTPTFLLSLYDAPGGSFDLTSQATFTLLDSTMITGNAPGSNHFQLTWSDHVLALDASGSTDGNVALVFDLTTGGYAAFDNVVIAASNVAGELPCDNPVIPVPEPATILLLALGMAAIGAAVRLRRGIAGRRG